MDKITPGRKLILDLLAKSIVKIHASSAEAINKKEKDDASAEAIIKEEKVDIETEMGNIQKKSKSAFIIPKPRKKMKTVHKKRDSHNFKEKKDFINKKRFKVKPESKSLDVEHLEMKTESFDFDKKEKIRKTNKTKKSFKVETGAGKDMNKYESELALKAETQESTVRVGLVTEQKAKHVKGKLKTEGPFNIKMKYTECKTEEVDLVNVGTTDLVSVGILKNEVDVFKKIRMEDSSEVENIKLESKFGHKTDEENRTQKHNVVKIKRKGKRKRNQHRPVGNVSKRFTPEDDQVLIDAIEKSEDKLDINQLARDLDRNRSSIINRIEKLKTGETRRKVRTYYTLEEDILILDVVLKYLTEQSLETLTLSHSDWKEVGGQIGRGRQTIRRWDLALKPWILQHYAGTFNLDIRRPLANYLADSFNDVNSIDWNTVASLPDFVGHTQDSLRHIFFTTLTPATQRKLNMKRKDISLRMIADIANTIYLHGSTVELPKNVKRQKAVVEYFESYVKTNCITEFLR